MNAPCTARRGVFRGWDAAFLANEFVRLVLVPDIGGRVMAYDLDHYPFLFVDPELAGKLFTPEENQGDGSLGAWKNYGGDKTWPAPQGWNTDEEWHGPPDPVLDSGRYTLDQLVEAGGAATVRVTSPPDGRTGLRICRQFTLKPGSSRVELSLTFRNISQRTVRWSIWDVVQLNAARTQPDGSMGPDVQRVITAPVNPHSAYPKGYGVLFGADDNPQWRVREDGLFEACYQWQIGKVALDSPAGWVAFSSTGANAAWTASFNYQPDGDYPDGGASVEVWTTGAGQVGNLNYEDSGIYLMEAEVLSPLFTLEPGASATFPLEWASCQCDGVVVSVTPAGALTRPLAITREANGSVRLVAAGGCFDAGVLHLRWRDAAGELLRATPLGTVSPLQAAAVDQSELPPHGAAQAELTCVLHHGEALQWSQTVFNQEGITYELA